jgi:hypothetical protein
MPELSSTYGKEYLYFTDEMRYGTRTASKRRWCRQGRRPVCKVKIGYQWGYLYVALCPATADLVACFCSHLDGDCFQYFGSVFQQHIRQKDIQQTVLLIGDQATAHQAHRLPDGILWQALPAACPELNPVERFFEELRKILANRVFLNKQEVEDCLAFWIHQYLKQPDQIIQLTNFDWIDCAV